MTFFFLYLSLRLAIRKQFKYHILKKVVQVLNYGHGYYNFIAFLAITRKLEYEQIQLMQLQAMLI